jgi:hypothetical protein
MQPKQQLKQTAQQQKAGLAGQQQRPPPPGYFQPGQPGWPQYWGHDSADNGKLIYITFLLVLSKLIVSFSQLTISCIDTPLLRGRTV